MSFSHVVMIIFLAARSDPISKCHVSLSNSYPKFGLDGMLQSIVGLLTSRSHHRSRCTLDLPNCRRVLPSRSDLSLRNLFAKLVLLSTISFDNTFFGGT